MSQHHCEKCGSNDLPEGETACCSGDCFACNDCVCPDCHRCYYKHCACDSNDEEDD